MESEKVENLNTEVTELKYDIKSVGSIVERLDTTITHLAQVSTNVSQLLAVQSTKLDMQEKSIEDFYRLMEKRRDETEIKFKELKEEIHEVEGDIKDEVKNIVSGFDAFKSSIDERINKLEKWVWTVLGGSLVVGFILSKLDFSALF